MKNTTIKTIAEATRLSLTTVSRVLNGSANKYRISEATQKIVLEAAKKLDYTPNQAAINLRLQRSFSIGLIIPSLSNPYFANVASIVSHSLREKGYSVILIDCDESETAEIEALDLLAAQNIDGILIVPSGVKSNHLEMLIRKKIPVVCIDRYFEDIPVSYVATDHYEGAYRITESLIRSGHRAIACIQGSPHVVSSSLRVKGYKAAMEAHRLSSADISGSSFTMESGYIETKLLLQKQKLPTAIFALSDTILLGVLRALEEEKINVPADMSLVTFDNSSYLDFLACPVTSISQPVADIAKIAIKILLDKMTSKNNLQTGTVERILIKPSVIHRRSVTEINDND